MLRDEAGLSQAELADAIGSTQRTISYMESDARERVDLDLLVRIARYFKVTVDQLVGVAPLNKRRR